MLKKISTVLLSVTIAVFTAFQAQGAETKTDRSEVRVLPQADVQVESGKKIGGEIRITAALREMQSREDVTVKFTLAGDRHTYETTVIVTPDSEDEEGLLSATARRRTARRSITFWRKRAASRSTPCRRIRSRFTSPRRPAAEARGS